MTDNNKPTESILGIVVGFAILFYFFKASWLLGISIIVGLIGLFSTTLSKWIHWGWMRLVGFIGFINSHLLLGIVFYLILFPIAALYKLTGKDNLNLKKMKGSAFQDRDHQYAAKDFENPW